MPDDPGLSDIDDDICMAHERLVGAMQSRLPAMSSDTQARYVALLSSLADKLEDARKTLREVARDMMSETMGLLLPELGRGR